MARQFGATWWGRAWIDALEHRAQLDPNRLPRGRTYARQDRVARLDVEPGRISALVRGSRVLPYRVVIGVPTFDDEQWQRIAGAIAGRAVHAAALLDGELEPGVLDDVREVGIDLLPGPGDVSPRCSCPDWADPCKHAAAVCYLVADALDEDPFVLFTLRGRSRDRLLESVRSHRRAGAVGSGDLGGAAAGDPLVGAIAGGSFPADDAGMVAREAWSLPRREPPARRELPAAPGVPAAWPSDPPDGAPFTAAGLTELAVDAARRAWHHLAEGSPSALALDAPADLARRAADRLARDMPLAPLALAAGVPATQLDRQATAWRAAGAEGVAAVDAGAWQAGADVVERTLAAFEEAGVDADAVQVRSNRFTVGDVQLRVTADGRWWRYERRGRVWSLVEPPADTPDDLLST